MQKRIHDLEEENAILKRLRAYLQKKDKAKLVAKIKRIHLQSGGIYGSPKIAKVLHSKGIKVSLKIVLNIMK